MTDTIERRIDRLERNFAEICAILNRVEKTIALTQQTIVQIRREIARSVAPVAHDAPDGTVALRDPNIIAQQLRTGVRGYSQHPAPPPEPPPPP
jgi:uncharacterized coiled-coil protein SlyX